MSEPGGNGKKVDPLIDSRQVSPRAILLLQRIKSGEIDAAQISEEQRRVCVEYFKHAGIYTNYEMADILKVSEKTILRDKKKITEANILEAFMIDEAEVAFETNEKADHYIARLVKNGRYEKAWTIHKERVELLQSMGFLKKVQPDLNIKGQISLKEVFENAATDPFKPGDLSPRFGSDILEGFLDPTEEEPQ